MAKAKPKTVPTSKDVKNFIESVENETRKKDAYEILDLLKEVSGVKPKMWGPSIIGFGEYHYKYESGREGDMCRIGFSPRKANQVLYIIPGYSEFDELLGDLGKYRKGKSCLYINKLDDVDRKVLKKIVKKGWADMKKKYPM